MENYLNLIDEGKVLGPYCLEDDVIRHFHYILERQTNFRPRSLDFIWCLERMEPVQQTESHLQIIYRGSLEGIGHWTTIYYNGDVLRVYDSLLFKDLSTIQQSFISKLFPFAPRVQFIDVQRQTNNTDCGVFAIAFATSLALGRNPAFQNFVVEEMRLHLLSILRTSTLLAFPAISRKPWGNLKRNIFANKSQQSQRELKAKEKEQTKYIKQKLNINPVSAPQQSTNVVDNSEGVKRTRDFNSSEVLFESQQTKRIEADAGESKIGRSKKFKIGGEEKMADTFQTESKPISRQEARKIPIYRELEQKKNTIQRRLARGKIDNKLRDQLRNAFARKRARSVLKKLVKERILDKLRRQKKRKQFLTSTKEKQREKTRQNRKYKSLERERDPIAPQKLQDSSAFKVEEQMRDRKARYENRQNIKTREIERIRDAVRHRRLRKSEAYKEEEKMRDRKARQQARKNKESRIREQKRDAIAHRQLRESEAYKGKEKLRDTKARRKSRQKTETKIAERERDAIAHRQLRESEAYKGKVKLRDTKARRKSRQKTETKIAERERDAIARRQLRVSKAYRTEEQNRDRKARRQKRQDIDLRKRERNNDAIARRKLRRCRVYRTEEQRRDTRSRYLLRKNLNYRLTEQCRDKLAKRAVRAKDAYRNKEKTRRRQKKIDSDKKWGDVTQKFAQRVNDGFTEPCFCCGRLWRQVSLKEISKKSIAEYSVKTRSCIDLHSYCNAIFFMDTNATIGNFCRTCSKSIHNLKIPKLAQSNGLNYPSIPEALEILTPLEERLVSPRHIFLKIVRKGMGIGYQNALSGNVINVPVELDTMVSLLPRSTSDHHIISVELKRKMCYKHGRKERVRPQVVRNAAHYLVGCNLFRKLGIKINESWGDDMIVEDEEDETRECTCHDGGAEEEEPVNPGDEETLLQAESDLTLIMAPGEGKRPFSLIYDDHLEELAFIKIHCGQERAFKVKLSHSDVVRSEVSRHDRRAMRPDYLFTALKKQQSLYVKNNILICLRKKTLHGAPILAGNVVNESYLNSLIQHDDGYRVLSNIRSSPSHWESEKKRLLAMVRQFGIPTLFITLSAAETRWAALIKMLKKVVDKEIVSLEEAEKLPYSEKARLIQADPFVCATYFDTRFQELRKTWSCPNGPFGSYKINHFYFRIEFQHRGSPHAHMILWMDKAPKYNTSNNSTIPKVVKFIDKIISCSKEKLPKDLVDIQTHKHTQTCHPKRGRPCRFEIPFFPMEKTDILLEIDSTNPSLRKWRNWNQSIREKLECIPNDVTTYDEFLKYVGRSHEEYILAIRSQLKKPKVFLRRKPTEIYVNPYSKKIIELHEANMDIQFILDPYACSLYIVNYINKADRGLSRLLRAAVEEVKQGNKGIRESLRSISNVFLNASEISAQEAVYSLIGLPMSMASESSIFINTNRPNARVHLLKSHQDLRNMDANSTDIFQSGLLEYYSNRPSNKYFDEMCLAYFSSFYTYSKKINSRNIEQRVPGEGSTGWISLLNGKGYIRCRKQPKVIRFCRFSSADNIDEFYREQLMLYLPWRDEHTELLDPNLNLGGKFKSNIERIRDSSMLFNKLGTPAEFEKLLESIRRAENDVERASDIENLDRDADQPLHGFEYEQQHGDVMEDLIPGGRERILCDENVVEFVRQPPQLSEDDFLELTRSLNSEQRDFLIHIAHKFQLARVSFNPLYYFISGGAGVGKSVLIKAIFQCLSLVFDKEPGVNPDDVKILLTAPTGKAAFGIGGQSLHSAFLLPVSQAGYQMTDLSSNVANTLHSRLRNLKLLIIDEVSMVGARTLHQINRRLQQIFHSKDFFGGISVIVVGDLRQLAPIGDNWVFQPTSGSHLDTLSGCVLWEQFQIFELTSIMRQKDDAQFAIALNNMAKGAMTCDDLLLIESRCFQSDNLPLAAQQAVHLFSSNRETNLHNETTLGRMFTEGAEVEAIDDVFGEYSSAAKKKALDSIVNLPASRTYGLSKKLLLRISARYMVTINLDVNDGLVNGASGVLKAIDFGTNKKTGERRPLRLWLLFPDPDVAKNKRSSMLNCCGNYQKNIQNGWVPIECVSFIIKTWKSTNLKVRRTQFPVVPAEAITVHKSQGATFEKVVFHLSSRCPRALMYVACSRATSSQGLFIISERKFSAPNPPSHSSPLIKELARLRENPLVPMFRFLREERLSGEYQIYFHNVQSLRKHLADVVADPVVRASDIIILVETWSGSSTDLTPSLISFYDKLTCNHFHEDRNGNNVDAISASAIAEESNCCNHTKKATSIAEEEAEVEVVTGNGSANVTGKVVQSVVSHSQQTTSNCLSTKHCNFRILSPNVQRLISNSTTVDRIENGHVQYHTLNNGCLAKSNKRVVVKQKLSHIPLSKNTCKLTQAGNELVETFDSSLSSSESLDSLQTPTNKPSTNGAHPLDNDKTPTNSHTKSFSFDNDSTNLKIDSKIESNHSESDHNLGNLRQTDLIEDIHQAEADRISAIIQRFHQMYTSTLIDKDESLKDSMDSLLENNIREIRGTNDKTTYETYNFLVRQPSMNENSSVDKSNNYLNKSDSQEETMSEAADTPPESPIQPHKKLSPTSSPLLTYSRTKKLGSKPSLHGQKSNRKHSPPSSSAETEVDGLSEMKPASPNNNRPNPLLEMAKGKHRPLSSSSICSTLSNSSSGSDNNHGGKMPVSYLASVESLADHSENENLERRGSNLTVLKRSCMEIIDSEKSYVKDLFQIIDGYLIQWKDDASLKDDDIKILFSNIQDIHSFNADLLDQLVEAGIDAVKIANCFIQLKDRFDVYTTYCTSYPEAIALLTNLEKASHTNTLLRLTQKNLKHTLPLGAYLLKPVQRILKYHLLLDNLRKHCDNKEIAQAHALMREVAWNIDQVKKKLEQKTRVKEVRNILDGWLGPDLTVLGELKQEGILMENNKPRQVFLFQTMLIITKQKEDERLQFKQYIHRKNLMLREHLPGEPTSFNVIPFDEPRNQIKLTSKNRDQKREWTQNIKDVMLEQFDIPSRAKELVYKLGDEEDRTPDKNIWKWGSNSTTPVYLERRNQYRRSEMRNRSKMKRKTITNSTSLDGFSANKEYTNNLHRKQSMDDTMMPSVPKLSDNTFIAPPKLKPGRCNHSADVCRCSLIRQEFETLAEQNNMKERSKSVPKISGVLESDDENHQQSMENLTRKVSDSSTLYKFSTLGRSKSSKVADVKVYTTKTIPKRIATLKKNKSRKETSKFYMDLSDFDDTVLKITESTENLKSDKVQNGDVKTETPEVESEVVQPQVELTEEEKNERAITKDKLKRDAEIISELLKVSLNRVSKKPPKKRSFDNTSSQSSTNLGYNSNVTPDDLPPPLPSNSPPPLDLEDETDSGRKQQEDHIYESLRRNVHVPYKFSPVLNRSKSQQYYSSATKVEKKSRSLPRPESDYVTLVYNESGDLKGVGETPAHITSGNEVLRNSDSNINYENISKKPSQSSPTSSTQCFSSIGDLQAQEVITNKSSKNLLQRFISVRGDHHVSTSESSLLPRISKIVENSGITRGNKPPERRVSDVTEMCRQSIIHRQGSDAVGERMANLDYVDPRTLFVSSANNSTVSLDPQRDSVFSLTSSNDSVSESNMKTSPIIEETASITAASLSEGSTYYDYEKNVEACLENDFRDSAVYSDDNEQRRQDCDQPEFSDFHLSPPPLPRRRVDEANGAKRASCNGKKGGKTSKRGVPPPIPAKPFIATTTKRLSGASSETKLPESCSPPYVGEGKSWVLKQIENFNK